MNAIDHYFFVRYRSISFFYFSSPCNRVYVIISIAIDRISSTYWPVCWPCLSPCVGSACIYSLLFDHRGRCTWIIIPFSPMERFSSSIRFLYRCCLNNGSINHQPATYKWKITDKRWEFTRGSLVRSLSLCATRIRTANKHFLSSSQRRWHLNRCPWPKSNNVYSWPRISNGI